MQMKTLSNNLNQGFIKKIEIIEHKFANINSFVDISQNFI